MNRGRCSFLSLMTLRDGNLKKRKKDIQAAKEAAAEAERLAMVAASEAARANETKRFDISDDAIRGGRVGISFVATVSALMYQ